MSLGYRADALEETARLYRRTVPVSQGEVVEHVDCVQGQSLGRRRLVVLGAVAVDVLADLTRGVVLVVEQLELGLPCAQVPGAARVVVDRL